MTDTIPPLKVTNFEHKIRKIFSGKPFQITFQDINIKTPCGPIVSSASSKNVQQIIRNTGRDLYSHHTSVNKSKKGESLI